MARIKSDIVTKESRKRSILKKKPVKLPSVVNGVKISDIPEKKKERRRLLKKELKIYLGEKLYCPALKAHVLVDGNSVDETKFWASKSINSTVAALNLKLILKNARLLKTEPAKDNKRQREMDIEWQKILFCPLKSFGIAKITVGKTHKQGMIHYCITSITLEKYKNEE